MPSWEIQVNMEVYSSTLFTHLEEVLMIWLYSWVIVLIFERKNTVNGSAWSTRLAPCKGIHIRNSGNLLVRSSWNLGNFDGGIRDPGLWNPESTEWNPESRTVSDPLIWDNKAMLSPQIPRNFIYLGSVLIMSNEDGFLGYINKVRLGKIWGVFTYPTASRLKSRCITAASTSSVFLYGRSIGK